MSAPPVPPADGTPGRRPIDVRLTDQRAPTRSQVLALLERLFLPAAIGVLGYVANDGANRIAEGQLALAEQTTNNQAAGDAAERQLRLLDLVYPDLLSADRARQSQALELTRQLEPQLAASLARSLALNTTVAPPVRERAAEIATSVQQLSPLYGYRIGIYYLRGNDTLASLASRIKAGLAAAGAPNVVVVNPRDAAFFTQTAPPSGNEVRFEAATEAVVADALQNLLRVAVPDSAFTLRAVSGTTPNFLSIYLS